MDSVGKLLQHTGPDQATHTAALVVATVNAVLQERVGVLVRDARATSFQQGTIRIHVSHGAVAGQLNQRAEEILELCSTFPSDTSFHQSSISSAFGVMKEFVLTIRLGHLLSYFKEVQAKTGPRPLAAISRLETLLRLICRDTHMIGTLPGVGERDEE